LPPITPPKRLWIVLEYIVYRELLARLKPEATLYLGIPENVFSGFPTTILTTIQANDVKLIIVDTEAEAIVQWID